MSQKEKEDCGFRYSKEDETFSTVNPNIYAKLILRNYRLMYHDSGNYYVYHAHCWRPLSDHKIKQVLREFFHKFEDNKWKSSLQSTYMSALPYECRDESQLKSAENYINVKNGLLDLSGEKTKIKQHNSNIFSTTQIPITYDPDAQCPKFEEYLNVTFQGDKDLIKLVQQIMGYCLSRTTKAHKMFIFLGSGSNGKSLLCEIMTALAGGVENVSNVAIKDLNRTFALSQIVNKTLNISTENETDKPLDTETLKKLAAGEPVQMEEKFQNPFSYKPYVKLVFAMNELPYAKDRSYGFDRRIIIVPFNMRFVDGKPRKEFNEAKMDRDLADTLIKDELGGIFAFAIRGLESLKKSNFKFHKSEASKRAYEEYKEQIDVYWAFVRENVVQADDETHVLSEDLWKYFLQWCEREGHSNAKKISFTIFRKKVTSALENASIKHQTGQFGKKRKRGIRGVGVIGLNVVKDDDGKIKKKTPSPKPRDEIDELFASDDDD